jgi:hypothetical protein
MNAEDWQDAPTDVYEPYVVLSIARDETTRQISFDGRLGPEEKLVLGYLTLEENDLFAPLSLDEQLAVARTLTK